MKDRQGRETHIPPFGVYATIMESWEESLRTGDEVYWNDPDEGICSGHGTFVRHLNDEVVVIRKDDVEMEVFVKELS